MRIALLGLMSLLVLVLPGCGGEDASADPTVAPPGNSSRELESESPEPTEAAPSSAVGDACALLDPAFLNDLMQGSTTMVGQPYEFQEPLTQRPDPSCSWKEGSTALDLRVSLEPTESSEIDDHSGRAYNIDEEPVAVPQDGPGTSAVLLTDEAFAGSGQEAFAYGYFFVADDVTVFVKSVGLDLGEDKLRAIADEVAGRLAAR